MADANLKRAMPPFATPVVVVAIVLCLSWALTPVAKLAAEESQQAAVEHESEKANSTSADSTKTGRHTIDPLATEGPLSKAAEHLVKLVALEWDGPRLSAVIPEDNQAVYPVVNEIRQAAGGGGGHGSSGNGYWFQSLYGYELSGILSRGAINHHRSEKTLNPDQFEMRLDELTETGRSMLFSGLSPNEFNVLLHGGTEPWMLHFRQFENGVVTVQEINADETFCGSGADFESFSEQYPTFVKSRLVPCLARFGIQPPITRYHPSAVRQVKILIGAVDQQREQAFRERFADLDAKDFKSREQASKLLEKEFEEWKEIIRRSISSNEYSFETRSRLTNLLKEKSSDEDNKLLAMIAASKLTDDVSYLIWMLEEATETENKYLTDRLMELTGEHHGADRAAWRQWHDSSRDRDELETAVLKPASLVEAGGYLQQMAEPVSDLVQLTVVEDRLVFDRDAWKAPFNGKTIAELVKETRTEVSKRNLPANWFNSRVTGADPEVDFAQVLFMQIESSIPASTSRHRHSLNSFAYHSNQFHKHFEKPHLIGSLDFQRLQKPPNQRSKEATRVRLCIREQENQRQMLHVYEAKDRSLLIQLVAPRENAMLQFYQAKDGSIACSLIEADKVQSFAAKDFQSLRTGKGDDEESEDEESDDEKNDDEESKEHISRFDRLIAPGFARFGIQLAEQAGGPLKIVNEKPEKK